MPMLARSLIQRGPTVFGVMLLACLVSVGCSARVGGDGQSLTQHNDELRRDNLELRQQIEETQTQLGLLESELRVYRDDAAAGQAIPGVTPPVFTGLTLGRYSGPVDTDGDGRDDELRLYVKPTDQRGRTLVLPGRAKVQLLRLGGASPEVVADPAWDPAAWDDAYRSGFTGSHYSLVVPLSAELPEDLDQLTVLVELTDAARGTVRRVQTVYPLDR